MARQRDLQREATREHLFTTALALFDEQGYDAVGIDDIVAKARVARGTFYFHFPAKDDVLIELIRRSDAHIVGKISKSAAVRRGKPLRTVLKAATDAFAEVWTDKRALLPHAGAVALRRIAAVEAARDQQPLRLELVKHVGAAIEDGELEARLPAQILADMFLLNVFAALMAWSAAAAPRTSRDVPEGPSAAGALPLPVILAGVIDLFLHGAAGS